MSVIANRGAVDTSSFVVNSSLVETDEEGVLRLEGGVIDPVR